MTALLSNNFEQVAGMLTYAECKSIIEHYDGVSAAAIQPRQTLRFPALLSWLQFTRQIDDAYTSWTAHRAAWTSSPTTWLSYGVSDATRRAALARGDNLYTANDASRDANLRSLLWVPPTNNKAGWRVPNVLFWSGSGGGTPAMTSGSGTIRNANLTTFGTDCAAAVNADHPVGYRCLRPTTWPVKCKATLSGGETVYWLRDSEKTGGWPNLYQDDWIVAVQAQWSTFLAAFEAAGGKCDYFIMDNEYRDNRNALQAEAYYYHEVTPTSVAAGNTYRVTLGAETFAVTAADTNATTLCNLLALTWNMLSAGSFPNLSKYTCSHIPGSNPAKVTVTHKQMSLGCGVPTTMTYTATGMGGMSTTIKRGKDHLFPHPNYPQSQTWYDAITTDVRLTDAYLASEYLPTRAEMELIETWGSSVDEYTARFDEQRYSSLRRAFAEAIMEPLLDVFPNCKCHDYEDMLKCGGIVPSSAGSPFASIIGPGYAGGTHQDKNFYSGTNISSNTKSYTYVPGTGFEEITRTSEVQCVVANPATGAVFKLTLNGYEVTHTVTAGQTAAQVASALVTNWNAVSSATNAMVARYDAAIVSGATFRLYPAGASSTWKHEIEEVEASVTGTGTLTATVTGFGFFPRFLDDMWRLQGMISASDLPVAGWLLPYTDPTFSFYGPKQTRCLHMAIMLACAGYVTYWNGNNGVVAIAGAGDDHYDATLTLAATACENRVAVPLPMPIRSGYQSLADYTQDYYLNGRIMRLTVTKYGVYTIRYQPLLAAIGNKTAEVGSELTFTAAATDADSGDTQTYSLSGAPSGATIGSSSGVFSWTPSAGQSGSHEFSVVVTDSYGLANRETISVQVDTPVTNTAPVIDLISTQSASEHTLFTFTPSAEDPEEDTLTWSFGGAVPAGMEINPSTGQVSWTPNETHGGNSYSIPLVVTDDGTPNLSGSRSFTINVTETNTAPVITPIGAKQGTEGALISFSCEAFDTDDPAQTLTWSLPGSPPSGASITSGGAFTWTPSSSQSGTHNITFRVTDNGSSPLYAEEVATFTIADVNRPPVLAAIGPQEVTVGETLTFTASATDPDGDDLTFTLEGDVPAGAAITTAGVFTWTPTAEQGGRAYPILVQVADDGSPSFIDSETVVVNVLNPESDPPTIVTQQNWVAYVGEAFTLTVGATPGAPEDLLSFELLTRPVGNMAISQYTGVFTWTPVRNNEGYTYNVVVQVEDSQGQIDTTSFYVAVRRRLTVSGSPAFSPALFTGSERSLRRPRRW